MDTDRETVFIYIYIYIEQSERRKRQAQNQVIWEIIRLGKITEIVISYYKYYNVY